MAAPMRAVVNILRKQSLSQGFIRVAKRNYKVKYYDPEKYHLKKLDVPRVEETADPEEWRWVERLLPMKTVPEPPKLEDNVSPSGWVPTSVTPGELPYHVRRSRNHMIPVYFHQEKNGRQWTKIHGVSGDLWKFSEDVIDFLNKKYGQRKKIATHINEVTGIVRVKGRHLEAVAEFLITKGL